MEEIPFVYPNNADKPRRYFVDTQAARVKRSDEKRPPIQGSSSSGDTFGRPLDEALPGAASVSSIKLRGQDSLVTTSALVDSPEIISVALSWRRPYGEDALDCPILIELDIGDLQVVSARAFSHDGGVEGDESGESCARFHLVLVGCQGTIVSIVLDDNLMADSERPLKVLFANDYISPELQTQIVSSTLQPNMVSFLLSSKHQIVMALAPLILTIDWMDSEKAAVWSETQCLEDMRARETYFGGISFTNLLLGKVEAGIVDMPPTAAICVSSNYVNDTKTTNLVFTLHSDASIRKWQINPEETLVPFEVFTLETDHLISPSTWSDERNSVALCARVYGQTFALAVYIKTDTFRDGISDCNICAFDGQASGQVAASSLELKVPNDAITLVNMTFVPTERSCILAAVFDCLQRENGTGESTGGIQLATYPHSFLSIVGPEPSLTVISSLDGIAVKERDRIRALPFGSIISEEIAEGVDDSAPSVEEVLHRLDTMYMKHLFRPIFPRGNGTVLSPSNVCIRRALSKLVHGAVKEYGMSVELETIKTLYEWRNRDRRKSIRGTPRRSRQHDAKNLYESFVEDEEDDGSMEIDLQEDEDRQDKFELDLHAEVEAQEHRWQRLLYQIWEEEQILRSPLCVTWLESLPIQVMVRGGVTTVLSSTRRCDNDDAENSWRALLEEASLRLLDRIESDPDKSNGLYEIEGRVAILISRAQLEDNPHMTFIEKRLTSFGLWVKNTDRIDFQDHLDDVAVADIVAWVDSAPNTIGASIGYGNLAGSKLRNSQQRANTQLRHAACSFSVRAVDAVRRIRLARCMLLLALPRMEHATTAAIRAYLHSISIMWVSAQRLKVPETAVRSSVAKVRFTESTSVSSQPNKRLSFGDVPSSISGEETLMTTVLDIVMMGIAQDRNVPQSPKMWPSSTILDLVGRFVKLIFPSDTNKIDGVRSVIPELCVLPKPRDREIATDHPDLALRLLAPFVAFQIPEDAAENVVARKNEFSSCLLYSAQSSVFSSVEKAGMRQKACDLLVPNRSDLGNPVEAKLVNDGLRLLASLDPSLDLVLDLKDLLSRLLPSATSIEITRVAQLDSTRKLFSSLTAVPLTTFNDVQRSSLNAVARGMLRLSRIFHRLNILESYISSRKDDDSAADDYNSESLLHIISDAIVEMELTFPKDLYLSTNEYRSLWTKKFNHARRSGRWHEAYSASFRNPIERYRDENLRLLVKDMVDNGALGVLLDLCRAIGLAESEASMDLYDIASDVLLYNSMAQDVYDLRAASLDAAGISDYQGALYALHASQERWRRAAQALDLRYAQAEKCLQAKVGQNRVNILSTELRDALIVGDLVLAACGSANAIELVKDLDNRFLVSGEYGPFGDIVLRTKNSGSTSKNLKRGRFGNKYVASSENGTDKTEDRLSRFMGPVKLDCRAIRSIGLRALFFDRSTDSLSVKNAFLRDFDTSKDDVGELFKTGYYQHGLLLAKQWSNGYEALNGSTKPGGVDLFGIQVHRLMGDYLIPLSFIGRAMERPTLEQLHFAIDAAGMTQTTASYIVTEKSVNLASIPKSAVRAATSDMIRKLTIEFSSAETPIALDVARIFLDQSHDAQLPVWLENLMIGSKVPASQSGAFAPRPKAGCNYYMGDPAGLLTLYKQHGMFVEACNVVISVLNGRSSEVERATKATARLPEKGDIDFVPYRSIDVLWNLIEIAVSKDAFGADEKASILKARGDMEKALTKHFELMNVSEVGMRSARLLQE